MSEPHNGDSRSIGQLVASATAELCALVHDEIALAKAEPRQDAKRRGLRQRPAHGRADGALLLRADGQLRRRR